MTQPEVARLSDALSGRYRIERELGRGGMATVYLADDLKHNRKVALKVLRPELAAVVGAERFLAEIETTANLTHPHILPLHDSGEVEGFLFYVMPYVEGESLRERLDRERQLPVDEAVRIATNVAEALEYAHSQGVIHRDIKPANILLQSGKPVVSDFGIALAVGSAGGGRLTETGMSLGTPHYMSPEQATGDVSVGPATDIYSLGCVLYEMLVGEPPYTGSTAQAVLGRIVTGNPKPAREERSIVPVHVEAVIMRALEKVPADRFGSAGEMARVLGDPGFRWGERAAAAGTRSGVNRAWKPAALVFAVAAAVLGGAWALSSAGDSVTDGSPRYSSLLLPPGSDRNPNTSHPLSTSADGRRLAVRVESQDGVGQVWIFDSSRPDPFRMTPLDGSNGSIALSPSGEWVAFNDPVEASIRRAPTAGGPLLTLGPTGLPAGDGGFLGLAYGPDESVVFAITGGLRRLPPGGGSPEILTTVGEEGLDHRDPSFLPDGSGVLFTERNWTSAEQRLMILRFGEEGPRSLTEGHSGRITEDGLLVYGRGEWQARALSVAALDADWTAIEGEPATVLEGIAETVSAEIPKLLYSLADDGTLMYFPHVEGSVQELVWVHRDGRAVEPILDESDPQLPAGVFGLGQARVSPDGARIAFRAGFSSQPEFRLFTYDIARGFVSPVALPASGDWPVWTSDGERVAFNYFDVGGDQNLYWARVDDSADLEPLVPPNPYQQHAQEFTRDGRYLVYIQRDVPFSSDSDIWLLPLDGSGDARKIVDRDGNQRSASVSPDSRWMAYLSTETGSPEVWVTDFPEARSRERAYFGDAFNPVWSATGDELYFMRAEDRALMVVDVSTEPSIMVGVPEVVAEGPFVPQTSFGRGIDVHPDGERVLAMRNTGGAVELPHIEVVQNFLDYARDRLGGE